MTLKPLNRLSRDEVRDLVRVHAEMFAFLRYTRTNPGHDEERAHAFVERHWRQFRDMALDYLAVRLALAEKEAAAPWN
jgi:hypothetical protein